MKLPTAAARSPRGFTLVEAMVSLGILLVGLLGMAQLQVWGLRSNQGARATMRATQLAEELRAGIGQLEFGDLRLTNTGASGPTAPTPFGSLLFADPAAAHSWSDGNAIPGLTLDATMETDPYASGQPLYKRRWTVWGYAPDPGALSSAKVIAISVMYTERGSGSPREVLLYTERPDPRGPFNFLEANR